MPFVNIIDFYFSCWCERLGYTQSTSWKIHNTTEVQTMQQAAELFAKNWDDQNNMILLNNRWTGKVIIFVQDWRGRIAKFKITVETKSVYCARRIQ